MGKMRVWAMLAAGMALCLHSLSSTAGAATPPSPSSPLTINLVDGGGAMAFTQEGFENYAKNNPGIVSRFAITKAPAPEIPPKIKAMQDGGRCDIDLIVAGQDVLAAGIEFGIWEKLIPDNEAAFPGVVDTFIDPGKSIQNNLTKGYGLVVGFMLNGAYPMFNPAKVNPAPTTTQELLDWAKAHPGRFIYARPANSGPGRAFLMTLPYLLGDKNPKDPVNGWEKTWAYLEELGKYIEYYPSGTGATMKELGEGSRDMVITSTGWDINPRALGIVPKEFSIAFFKNMTFVNDVQYLMMPKNLPAERKAVVLDIIRHMLQPPQQALTWDKGYFYPGPVVKNVPLSMAPQASQDCINEFGRKEYETVIGTFPQATPIESQALVTAFKIWDERVGSKVDKK